ncbi:2-phospho-L-lactate guanylyltransferase [Nocardia tengchongensis]
MSESGMLWSVVVPIKDLTLAKSRLQVGPHRPELALAFARDTVTALRSSRNVGSIFIVSDDPTVRAALQRPGVWLLRERGDGLNRAVTAGLAAAHARSATPHLAVVMADLPALRPEHFLRAGTAAREFPRSFVADADGSGTTALFLTGDGDTGASYFGPDSHLEHARSGAVALGLDDIDGLRRDVDRIEHLHAAERLGVGTHTAAVLAAGEIRAHLRTRSVA